MAQAVKKASLDVREIPPHERHPRIFAALRALEVDEAMELVNDHDPRPLYYQIQSVMPGSFAWRYLATGPEVWHVQIVRTGTDRSASDGACCGGCSGG